MSQILQRLLQRLHQSKLLATLVRGAEVALVFIVSGHVITYVVQLLLARLMGAAEYGTYQYVINLSLILAVLGELGLPSAVLRFIPQYLVTKDWALLSGVIRGSWQLTLLASLAMFGLGTVVVLGLKTYQEWAYLTPMLVSLWLVPLLALVHLQSEIARAFLDIVLTYVPFRVCWPLLMITGALLLQQHYRLTSVAVTGIAGLALLTVIMFQMRLLQRRLAVISHSHPVYALRKWLRVSFPLLLSTVFLAILDQIDIVMLGIWLKPEVIGLYSAAAKTALWVSVSLEAVNTVAAPAIAALYTQGNREELQRLLYTVAHLIFWPSLTIAIGLIMFARPILGLFGPEFVVVRWELTFLALGHLVSSAVGSVNYLMNMTGHQNQSTFVLGWSALFNIVLNAVCIPLFGTVGAALATVMSIALWNIWLYVLVVKHLSVYPSIVSALTWKRQN
ncbi:oligosaccharide flippase family protein [Nostoc sp. CHAB 5784]|uniref:oligosaccharide flippase family protein n=1 Tax=Nostoc mirabile TaxID=2907820 RepID=UPI001E419A69|nr:oligosaccharide flippase family protein [Nostoc mirabile]MCC5669933.1 oligosaccharide flippase family protein [Nostoc mirabile CHAB5784]